VLVLDEPTSGLDSWSALQLMRQLRTIACSGRVVACSLHQPSPVLFDMLDTAMLLAAGRTIYQGPPSGAAARLAALGAPCPQGVPIAEHMLHCVCSPDALADLLPRLETQSAPACTPGGAGAGMSGVEDVPGGGEARGSAAGSGPWAHHVSLGREVGVLFWRSWVDVVRNPLLLGFHVVTAVVLGLLVGAIFYDVSDDVSGAQNRLGAMFFALCLLAFTSVTSIDLVQAERHVAARELRRRYYSPIVYTATKLVLDGLLLRALPALIFSLPFYFLMGLQGSATSFFTFLFVYITFNITLGALALGLAACFNSAGKTILVRGRDVPLLGLPIGTSNGGYHFTECFDLFVHRTIA